MPKITKKHKNKASIEKEAMRLWRILYPVFGVFSLVIIGAGFWAYSKLEMLSEDINHFVIAKSANLGFVVEDITIEGRKRTTQDQLLSIISVKRGDPILQKSAAEIKNTIESSSWIESAEVYTQLPNRIHIKIDERVPMAIWQSKGKHYVLDNKGRIIKGESPRGYGNLITVVGEKAAENAPYITQVIMKYPELASRITAATHLRGKRWDLRIDDRVDIKLPEDKLEEAMAKLIALDKQYNLSKAEIMIIDMRLDNAITIRPTAAAVAGKSDKGKDI